jgi:hypothetical protein
LAGKARLYVADDLLSGGTDVLYQSLSTGFFEFFSRGVDGKIVTLFYSLPVSHDQRAKEMIQAGMQLPHDLPRR